MTKPHSLKHGAMLLRQEVMRLSGRPGRWRFTWIKTPGLPWLLAQIDEMPA